MLNNKSNGKKTKFIDLFAGIGGFHLALHNLGGTCVFAYEWDLSARKTYEANFQKIAQDLFSQENFKGDITKVSIESIPNHDILCAGFPCQPFSHAGHRLGFEDTRGTLFFEIAEILKVKKPKAFLLENVRGLENHNKGNTFETIKSIINDLGYSFFYKIIKASDFGLPQHRPRIYMVGFVDKSIKFEFPQPIGLKFTMSDVFEGNLDRKIGFTLRVGGRNSPITAKGNWDGYVVNGVERRIGVKEAKKMQGFPENFLFPVSDTQAMKLLGNSVAIPVVEAIACRIIYCLDN